MENFKMVYIPYGDMTQNIETKTAAMFVSYIKPCDNEDTSKAKEEINELINDGWKIISTATINGVKSTQNNLGIVMGGNGSQNYRWYTITVGVEVFLIK